MGSDSLVPDFWKKKSVQNKHQENEDKTKSIKLKPLKTSSIVSVIRKLVLSFCFLIYHLENESLKDVG